MASEFQYYNDYVERFIYFRPSTLCTFTNYQQLSPEKMFQLHWNQDSDQASRRLRVQSLIVDWIENILWPLGGKTVIDLFSGPGVAAKEFVNRGISRYIGIDYSMELIELAKECYQDTSQISFIRRDLKTNDGEVGEVPQKADLILLCYEALNAFEPEHMYALIPQIKSFAKPGSWLIGDIRPYLHLSMSFLKSAYNRRVMPGTGNDFFVEEWGYCGAGRYYGHRYTHRDGSTEFTDHHNFIHLIKEDELHAFLDKLGSSRRCYERLLTDIDSDVPECRHNIFFACQLV
jgi:hypothetical protein